MPGQNVPVAIVLVACVSLIGYLQNGVQYVFHGEVWSPFVVLLYFELSISALEEKDYERHVWLSNGSAWWAVKKGGETYEAVDVEAIYDSADHLYVSFLVHLFRAL